MNSKNIRIIGSISVLISVGVIILSMYQKSIILLFIGIFLIVVSTFITILIPALNVFREDRILNKEELIKQGLHIVKCKNCMKENVFEDKYCVYCGEDLVMDDEEV